MGPDDSPARRASLEEWAAEQAAKARYAVVYRALGTTRIVRSAGTQLGAIRQALNLVEWLTDNTHAESGIRVTLDGATVEAVVRNTATQWTLILHTEKGRRATGRLSIYRELN